MPRRFPRRIATISVHTSPLEQPGTGDAGGLNVYVVEVAKRLAGRGVEVEIFTRAVSPDAPPVAELVPGVLVRHVPAGPFEELDKADLPAQLCQFTFEVLRTEAAHDPGRYDREVFLVLKEFEPTLSQGGDMAQDFLAPAAQVKELVAAGESAMQASLAKGMPHGYEVGYRYFTINGRMLGHGEPVRVKQGERVLFHILNGSATEIRSLALPGHTFKVVALDGNEVPTSAEVPVLWLGTAERISAIVEMNRPGVWIMGDLADDDRGHGMGIVVEYAGQKKPPLWMAPKAFRWHSRRRNGIRHCRSFFAQLAWPRMEGTTWLYPAMNSWPASTNCVIVCQCSTRRQ